MFTNTGCRTAPTAACTIPTSNTVFQVAGTGAATAVTLKAPTAYLATSTVVVSCTFPADGTTTAGAAVTVTATISATQQCTPVAWTYDQVVKSTGFLLSGPYTGITTGRDIATFANFF